MAGRHRVLLLGGTGRTGLRVLEQLLDRGVEVHAIVRSRARLPGQLVARPSLTVSEAGLLSLGDEELRGHVHGCDAVISCLGHTISLRGVFGPPRDLVTTATTRLCQAIRSSRPDRPVKLILMSSVSVNHPQVHEPRRIGFEGLVLRVLRAVVPPASDNQRAADYLQRAIGAEDPYIEWVAVRPDTLLAGEPSPYVLHEGIVSSLFKPASTNLANVAALMCDLVLSEETWHAWAGRFPVIVNAPPPGDTARTEVGAARGRSNG